MCTFSYCIGFANETMVCAVYLAMFLSKEKRFSCEHNSFAQKKIEIIYYIADNHLLNYTEQTVTNSSILFTLRIIQAIYTETKMSSFWSSLAALGILVITSGAASNDTFVKITFPYQQYQLNTIFSYQELLSHEGKDYNPGPLLQKAVSNVINQLVFGQRFPYTDPRFIRDIKVLDEALSISGNGGPLALFPWLRYLPGDLFKYKRILHLRRVLETDFQKCIDEHRYVDFDGLV